MSFQYQQNHSRRIVPPGASRKRKERGGEANASSSNGFKAPPPKAPSRSPSPTTTASSLSSNRLLAGYMAYEYLTKGTLFGQKYDPARSEAVPVAARSTKPAAEAAAAGKKKGGGGSGVGEAHESYAEVASILKSDGAHIPGIVNPTQLTKWIQM